jgi:hypothetical protein
VEIEGWTAAGLWFAVALSGLFHGVSPGMGWPLAVSAGMMGRGQRDLLAALGPLAAGHFLAMAAILLPFAAMTALIRWQAEIRIGAGLLVIAAGCYLLVRRRHPRFIARIRPAHLAVWSFAIALAHGAGLMLLPIYLGLCRVDELDAGHRAVTQLMGVNASMAVAVAAAHTLAMIAAGGAVALAVLRWLGPQFISRSWFNLEVAWAMTLILVGTWGLAGGAAAG